VGDNLGDPITDQVAPDQAGTLTFDTSGLAAGGDEAVLLGSDGTAGARVPLWLRAKDARVQLSTDKTTYAVGEPITVSWTDGPANRWDWLGVYKARAADPNVDDYLIWGYTGLHASGTVPPRGRWLSHLRRPFPGQTVAPAPGRYVVHYLLTDAYSSAGSAPFTVTN
jgi:hypothetical protein